MSERAKELWADFLRYLREAAEEWIGNFEDSPPSHAYTALIAVLVVTALRWFL